MSIKQEQKKAKRASLKILRDMGKQTKRIYVTAGNNVANEVSTLKTIGKGKKYQLTIASKERLSKSLLENGQKLNIATNKLITDGTIKTVAENAGRYTKYTAGFMQNVTSLDNKTLFETLVKVNVDLVEVQFLKTYSDGLKYSRRIWKSSKLFERDIRNVVAEGIARNRDIITISKDIKSYVRTDKATLAKRYANIDTSPIRPGETIKEWKSRVTTFKTRVSSTVEYNSLRIVRTQVQGAIQDSNIAAQSYTPSVDSFDWTLSPAHVIYSICEDIAEGNPWTYETFPDATPPHPNCLSFVIYKEKPQKEFVSDLKAWSKNPTAPGTQYLNDWKANYYDPTARGDKTNFFDLILARTDK